MNGRLFGFCSIKTLWVTKFSLSISSISHIVTADLLIPVHIMYIVVPSTIGSLHIRPHGPPAKLAFAIVNLVRRFVEQICLVLDTRQVCLVGGVEVGRLIHVEPDTIVFSDLSVFVETVFPPLSDV